jgi:hypothetical protein
MSDVQEEVSRRGQGRSPPFPFIPLGKAVERMRELESHGRGHPVRIVTAVAAWGYNAKSSGGLQTLAALKAYGLALEGGSGVERRVQITEAAKRLLRNPPEAIRQDILRKAALTPKVINEFWGIWGTPRPPDSDCLWTLQDERGFTPDAATRFLSVYDATLRYAGLSDSASIPELVDDVEEDVGGEKEWPEGASQASPLTVATPQRQSGVALMDGERIVFTEEGLPNQYLKLIASGAIDDGLLEALEDFVKRQRKRLLIPAEVRALLAQPSEAVQRPLPGAEPPEPDLGE